MDIEEVAHSTPEKIHSFSVDPATGFMELAGGLRSGMSYINATELAEIPEKARFMEMSPNGYRESGAHGVK